MTLTSINAWVSNQINIFQHSMLSFFLILESFLIYLPYGVIIRHEAWNLGQFDDKTLKIAHANSLYSLYISRWTHNLWPVDPPSLCSVMKYTFSFQRATWAKSWNMTAKITENDARSSQVDQFAAVTARPRLGTWSVVTSRVEGTNVFILQSLSHTSAGQSIFAHRCT